jgi:cysteinyl-tRNA synthetase
MIDDIFSEEIDIHGGGVDIMFPHHENEIAQSLACKGHRCANIWMHNGRLNLEGEKMSKSEGNVVWVKDLSVDPMAFRMFLLSTHYRAPIAYSQDSLDSYVNEWQRLKKSVIGIFVTLDYNSVYHNNCKITDPDISAIISAFTESMENDFNTANALTAVNQALKIINNLMRQKNDYERMNQVLKAMNYMLMILGLSIDQVPLTANDKDLLARWEAARKAKDFQLADVLRNELAHKNLV